MSLRLWGMTCADEKQTICKCWTWENLDRKHTSFVADFWAWRSSFICKYMRVKYFSFFVEKKRHSTLLFDWSSCFPNTNYSRANFLVYRLHLTTHALPALLAARPSFLSSARAASVSHTTRDEAKREGSWKPVLYRLLLKTGSLDNAIQEVLLA